MTLCIEEVSNCHIMTVGNALPLILETKEFAILQKFIKTGIQREGSSCVTLKASYLVSNVTVQSCGLHILLSELFFSQCEVVRGV
jgi:hypothetical protein